MCYQAHDSPVRTMVWSHNESWMVTGDHAGYVKYWQSNMNNVKMFQAHKEAIRGLRYNIHHTNPNVSSCRLVMDDLFTLETLAIESLLYFHLLLNYCCALAVILWVHR